MKKSIIASGIFASSRLNANTTLANHKNNEGHETSAYQWEVETEGDVFSGTCCSMEEVNKEISLLTQNKKVLKKNITPMTMGNLKEDIKIYTWKVVTKFGESSGVSKNFEEAKNMVESFGQKGIIKSTIIESITKEN